MPSRMGVRMKRLRLANMAQRICARSSFKLKYQWPEPGRRKFETSPSTHNMGKRSSMTNRASAANSLTA